MDSRNLYHELRDTLQGLKDFLDANVHSLKPGMQALTAAIPQVRHLADNLIYLLQNFKSTIQNLDVYQLPALPEVNRFAVQVEHLLSTARSLLPDEPDTVMDVRRTTRLLASLEGLEEVKGDILFLTDAIIGHLYELKG
ncbi:MAG TPA: hypothetical protein VKA14_04240 [Gammaproteobacteria bacterium]|nr:hypothetical protein [Gammaproteobacteria bacterium]